MDAGGDGAQAATVSRSGMGPLETEETAGYVSATGVHVFTPETFDGKAAEGTLATTRKSEFMRVPFEYKATFSAPAWRRPPQTSLGTAAAASPRGKATRSGDKAAIRETMTAEAVKALDGQQAKEMPELLKMISPDPATARIDSVVVKGSAAEVTVEGLGRLSAASSAESS